MFLDAFRNALVLTGPTGSGKTSLGVDWAEQFNAEIVSMDSMALYRGMDIGTAKPTQEQRRRVPHHLIDVLDPWESASVAWWLERAAACARAIEGRGRRVLFVGGTPLYLKAMLFGLFEGPPGDREIRERLAREAKTGGPQALHHRLAQVDPVSAARLHANDLRRVIRALEVFELTGRPISAWQQQWKREPPREDALTTVPTLQVLWLDVPRHELYARIDARVIAMFDAGLVEEARALQVLPHPLSREAAQAVGYQEVFEHLGGQRSLAETIQRVQQHSRNLAKRQITWFRNLPGCRPVSKELTSAAWGLRIG